MYRRGGGEGEGEEGRRGGEGKRGRREGRGEEREGSKGRGRGGRGKETAGHTGEGQWWMYIACCVLHRHMHPALSASTDIALLLQ